MKPEYGSHYEPANLAAHRQNEEIVRIEPEEIQAMHDAGKSAPETPEQIPLPGLSVAQTEFFRALKERFAKHGMALTVAPDGEMSTGDTGGSHDGKSYAYGSIHDPHSVFKLIPTMYDATLSREEMSRLMFKLFPGSTGISFLLQSKGGK